MRQSFLLILYIVVASLILPGCGTPSKVPQPSQQSSPSQLAKPASTIHSFEIPLNSRVQSVSQAATIIIAVFKDFGFGTIPATLYSYRSENGTINYIERATILNFRGVPLTGGYGRLYTDSKPPVDGSQGRPWGYRIDLLPTKTATSTVDLQLAPMTQDSQDYGHSTSWIPPSMNDIVAEIRKRMQ